MALGTQKSTKATSSKTSPQNITLPSEVFRDYAPINSKLQHPPPPNSRPLGPKWCSNALPYRRICMSYPTKEQSSSAPPVFNKDILKTIFGSQSLTNATSLPLNSSSRPNTCFITVSNFGATSFETQLHLKPDISGSIFPTPRRQRSNSPLPGHRRLSNARGWGGGGDVEVSI